MEDYKQKMREKWASQQPAQQQQQQPTSPLPAPTTSPTPSSPKPSSPFPSATSSSSPLSPSIAKSVVFNTKPLGSTGPVINGIQFPLDLKNLEVLEQLNGGTKPEKVKDPSTGNIFVKKKGNNKGHCANEYVANQVYRILGAPVPAMVKYDTPEGEIYLLMQFIDGTSWRTYLGQDQQLVNQVKKLAQNHFLLDCLFANWDVCGSDDENILVCNTTGIPYRIDLGGALSYRAQGELKQNHEWNDSNYVPELVTMVDDSFNPNTAVLFRGVTTNDMLSQLQNIYAKEQEMYALMSEQDKKVVKKRLQLIETEILQRQQYESGFGVSEATQYEESSNNNNTNNAFGFEDDEEDFQKQLEEAIRRSQAEQ